jgi:hypothetical protein
MTTLHKPFSKKNSHSRQTLMLHALGFVSGDPTIRIGYPFVFHPGVQVTVSEPGNAKWVYMMLSVPKGSLITEIKVAHHRSGIQSRITHIRLVQQREPVAAEVVHDDPIAENIASISVISSSCHVIAEKSVLLKICMEFANTDDMIEFGSIEVQYIPNYEKTTTSDEGETKRKEERPIYTLNKKQTIKNQPTLVDLFFKTKKKRTISNISNT